MADLKRMIYAPLLGGAITVFLGAFLVPYANKFLSIIPQLKILMAGVTPHVLIAYSIGYFVAHMTVQKILKIQ